MSSSSALVRDADPLVAAEPPINLVPATLVERLGTAVLTVCGQQVPVPALLRLRPALRRYLGRQIVVGIRPEHLEDAVVGLPADAGSASVLHGRVRRVHETGADRVVHLELAEADSGPQPAATLVARVSRRSSAEAGQAIMLAVDTRHLLVFDADSGRSLW